VAARIDHLDQIIARIAPNERTALVGPTRCGKSRLEGEILKHFDNVLLTAPKEQWDWNLQPSADPEEYQRKLDRFGRRAYDVRELERELREVAVKDNGDPIVFLPPRIPDRRLHRQTLDYPFMRALQRGHTLAVADDLYYHAHGTNFESAAPWLFYCITSGGGNGTGCMYAFQRPVWVPQVALSETNHFFVFYLQNADDRDTMDTFAGKQPRGPSPIDWETLKNEDYSFVYFTKRYVSEPLRIDLEKEAA
jgi:hypothetical protein